MIARDFPAILAIANQYPKPPSREYLKKCLAKTRLSHWECKTLKHDDEIIGYLIFTPRVAILNLTVEHSRIDLGARERLLCDLNKLAMDKVVTMAVRTSDNELNTFLRTNREMRFKAVAIQRNRCFGPDHLVLMQEEFSTDWEKLTHREILTRCKKPDME